MLADYPEAQHLKSKEFKKGDLKAGAHTEFSTDGLSLYAQATGYPKIAMQHQKDDQVIPVVSIVPLVTISFDRLSANLIIYPSIPGKTSLHVQNLEELIRDAGVHYGVDQTSIAKTGEIIAAGVSDITEVSIAQGTLPQEGTDALLTYAVKIGPIAGLRLKDGTIDYRERRIMVGVKKGDLIATKTPAVPGTPGTNVLGETIEPRSGKDIKIITLGDAEFSDTTQEVRATGDGNLSIVKNNTIKVSPTQQIEGDIDFNTGNIDSQGCLGIKGSVQAGFTVKSGGDLKISGNIMSSRIECEANCVIEGGITGKGSEVITNGDTDVKFIEQSLLKADGLIVIRSQSYFSQVTSGSDIRCNPSSIVMGGSVIAAGNLSLGTVGSETSEPATVGAGVDPDRLKEFQQLQQSYEERQNELISWIQMHGNAQSRKVKKFENEIDEIREQLNQFNLIPGTELFSRHGSGTTREEIEEENPLYHTGRDVAKITIDLAGTAYAGTKILLGNRSLTLGKTVSKRQFKLSRDMKRIIALPLRVK